MGPTSNLIFDPAGGEETDAWNRLPWVSPMATHEEERIVRGLFAIDAVRGTHRILQESATVFMTWST